jgi:hypothetical protein
MLPGIIPTCRRSVSVVVVRQRHAPEASRRGVALERDGGGHARRREARGHGGAYPGFDFG